MQADVPSVVCARCSAVNPHLSRFCDGCGASFLKLAQMQSPPSAQPSSTKEARQTFAHACSSCGNALPEGSRFCNNCGLPFNLGLSSGAVPPGQPKIISNGARPTYNQRVSAYQNVAIGKQLLKTLGLTQKDIVIAVSITAAIVVGIILIALISNTSDSSNVYIPAGQTGIVTDSKLTPVAFFANEQSLNDAHEAAAHHDEIGQLQQVFAGRMFFVDCNTKVLVLGVDNFRSDKRTMYKTRVLEGDHIGQIGYVPTENVRR
jgi:Double zinc ribbon